MKMLKRISLPPRLVLLLMLLMGSSTTSFSANSLSLPKVSSEDQQDSGFTSQLEEQVVNLYDFILPAQKVTFFDKGSFSNEVDLWYQAITHTDISQGYIKRSRFIIPSLGVKEVIFPFHVFL